MIKLAGDGNSASRQFQELEIDCFFCWKQNLTSWKALLNGMVLKHPFPNQKNWGFDLSASASHSLFRGDCRVLDLTY